MSISNDKSFTCYNIVNRVTLFTLILHDMGYNGLLQAMHLHTKLLEKKITSFIFKI